VSSDIPKTEARQQLTLTLHDTQEFLKVSTRTSGRFTFTVELTAPDGTTALIAPTTYIVTSTAVSGVAIGLSLLALAVLGACGSVRSPTSPAPEGGSHRGYC